MTQMNLFDLGTPEAAPQPAPVADPADGPAPQPSAPVEMPGQGTLTVPQEEPEADLPSDAPEGGQEPAQDTEVSDPVEPAGEPEVEPQGSLFHAEEVEAWTKEFEENNDLGPESREAIVAKLGENGEQILERYLNGLRAEKTAEASHVDSLMTEIGGPAQWNEVKAWANETLSEAEQEIYTRMANGSKEEQAAAVRGLAARYQASQPAQPPANRLGGHTKKPEAVKPYSTKREIMAAMADPRYDIGPNLDPDYRRSVLERLNATPADVVGI